MKLNGKKNARRKSALKLLERQLVEFKNAGVDKQSHKTTRTFESEVKRMETEIGTLKQKVI